MAASTDPNTGVTTVDELVVTARATPDPIPTSLQQASFRGVPFAVEVAEATFGRRNASHEYPYRSKPWIEDLGRRLRPFKITGFLVTNSAIYGGGDVWAQRARLAAAAETAGPGILIHPSLGSLTVNCETLVTRENWDAARSIEVEFSFLESGQHVFPAAAASSAGAVGTAADNADGAAAGDFSSSLAPQLTGGAAIDALGSRTGGWVGQSGALGADATSLFRLTGLLRAAVGFTYGRFQAPGLAGVNPTLSGATIAGLIAAAAAARAALAIAGGVERATAATIGLSGAAPTDLAVAAQGTVAALAAAAADPGERMRLLIDLQGFVGPGINNAAIATAVDDMHRRAAVVALARAASAYQPTSHDDAVSVRDKVAAALAAEIAIAGDEGADISYVALRALRVSVVRDLTARGANLSATVAVNLNSSLPALTLANRLYGDASRADQLVGEANPPNPLFMPASFVALAA